MVQTRVLRSRRLLASACLPDRTSSACSALPNLDCGWLHMIQTGFGEVRDSLTWAWAWVPLQVLALPQTLPVPPHLLTPKTVRELSHSHSKFA